MSPESTKDKLALAIWLSALMKAGPFSNKKMSVFLRALGSWENLDTLDYGDFSALTEIPQKDEERIKAFFKSSHNILMAREEAKRCRKIYSEGGMTAVFINETSYPNLLKEISSAPALLFCSAKRDISLLNRYFPLALIGSRNPTIYGKRSTEKIVSSFHGYELALISGMARGIDSLAHERALKEDILTVAVLGCGMDIVYPPENKLLMQTIAEKGILISECPPGTKPIRRYFPARNRIISGLSRAVIVTEASQKSGTMITAGFAADQGRDVFALPGNINSALSRGTNKLIQDGAMVITDPQDIRRYYKDGIRSLPFEKSLLVSETQAESAGLDASEIIILLKNSYLTFDELMSQSGFDFAKLANILAVYEINGLVQCENGTYFLT